VGGFGLSVRSTLGMLQWRVCICIRSFCDNFLIIVSYPSFPWRAVSCQH